MKDWCCCRKELLSTGKASLSASLVEHCVHNAAELLSTQHGGELLECLCCGGDVGSWLWENSRDSISTLHNAVAAAISGEAAVPGQIEIKVADTKETDKQLMKRSELEGEEIKANEADDSDSEEDSDEEQEAVDASTKQTAADELITEGEKDLTENFFATRALKHMVCCAHGQSGEGFLKQLWEVAIKDNVASLKGTHTCKVIAALAQCSVAAVAKGVRQELSEALGTGEDVDEFLRKFTVSPKGKEKKVSKKGKGSAE